VGNDLYSVMKRVLSQKYWIEYIKNNPVIVTILAGLSVMCLLYLQIYFVSVEIRLNKQEFEENMDQLLLEIHHSIEDDKSVSNQLIDLIKQFEAKGQIEDIALKHAVLKTIRFKIDSVSAQSNINSLTNSFVFYATKNHEIILSEITDKVVDIEDYIQYSERAGSRVRKALGKGRYRFGIHFPFEFWFLLKSLWFIFTVSLLLILILSFLFWGSITALKKQKQMAQLKNEFINNLTHELKTPIFASSLIYKIAEKNLQKGNIEALSNQLSILKSENHKLKSKVEKVLQLSVMENGKLEMDKSLCDIHEVIQGSLTLFEPIIKNLSGEIMSDLKASNNDLLIDKIHIGNVVNNLLDNAIKYRKGVPMIKVFTMEQNGAFNLYVQDYGKGIAEKENKKIFEKFYRISQGDLHEVKGFGLGLSYVKMIVALHNGDIKVKSTKNEGTVFCITLPIEKKVTTYAESKNFIDGR